MSWRQLIPLLLVGLVGVSAAASAALGAAQSPTSPTYPTSPRSPAEPAALSPEAQSSLFHTDVARTLTSKSFTFRFAGQTTLYQAPDRTEVVDASPGCSVSG